MDNRAEISAFLKSRRDKITPEQAGLPVYGQRRVPGLRRNEVATLMRRQRRVLHASGARQSQRCLRQRPGGAGPGSAARRHGAHTLVRPGPSGEHDARPGAAPDCPAALCGPACSASLTGCRACRLFVKNHRFDILVANPLGRALFSEMYADPVCGANTVRFVFLSPAARRFYVDWERIARGAVGALRIEAGKNPYDRELSNLIGELSTRSDAFRVMWGAHDVHVFHEGTKRLRHPVVGELELNFESMNLPDGSGLVVALYNAAPGSAAADALNLLASWSATAEAADVQAAEADSEN